MRNIAPIMLVIIRASPSIKFFTKVLVISIITRINVEIHSSFIHWQSSQIIGYFFILLNPFDVNRVIGEGCFRTSVNETKAMK